MSKAVEVESARRRFTGKRAETVVRLSHATVDVLRRVGYHDLTLQLVAAEAGVSRATAYMYFSSKDHLVAEAYWRRLSADAIPGYDSSDPIERVVAVMRYLALVLADEPALAYAVTVALNSPDPDLARLRLDIGRYVYKLISSAAGPEADRQAVSLLNLIYTGAVVRTSAESLSFTEVANELEAATRRILS
jgi:TetR/AcrR family transcriptional regulator, cholesterol catabolism regulator